jgi:hypothetical protein
MTTPAEERAEKLIAVFRELSGRLPEGAASVGSERTRSDDGIIVRLKPTNKRAAQFGAHIDDGLSNIIDVSFGAATTFELPVESLLPDDASFEVMLDTVRAMGLAVIEGRCQEYFGFIGIRGTIHVGNERPRRMTTFFHLRLFPKLVRYAPYVEQS